MMRCISKLVKTSTYCGRLYRHNDTTNICLNRSISSLFNSDSSIKKTNALIHQTDDMSTLMNQGRNFSTTVINNMTPEPSSNQNQTKLTPFILPDIGEGINEVIIREWLVKEGDHVKEFDPICEVESDKATATITSRFEGTISAVHYSVGVKAKVGKPLVDIMVSVVSLSPTSPVKTEDQSERFGSSAKIEESNEKQMSSARPKLEMLPSVRRLARLEQIDLSKLEPTGKNNRILKEDVLRYLENRQQITTDDNQSSNQIVNQSSRPINGNGRNLDRVELRNIMHENQSETIVSTTVIKRAMFKTMTKSLTIPHFHYADEIDMTNLVATVKKLNSTIKKSGDGEKDTKLSNLSIIIKMISMALLEYPELNGSLVADSGEEFMIKHYHNIGVAIDTKAGLIVPNIKNVQLLTIEQINLELQRLRQLAYQSKLGLADLSGGTISLSNIGAIGGTFGVPVIVSPEILIVALGKIRKLPRFDEDGETIRARQIVQAVWSADHRCVDGATLSRFSNLIKHLLEHPAAALTKMI